MNAARPTPSLVISMIALFVALSTTAVALDGSNTVFSDDIVDGEVKTPDLDGAAVTRRKVADGAVTTPKIGFEAVTRRKLASNAVNSAKILDGAVATSKIGFEAVTRRKLADDAVNSAKVLDGSLTGADVADNSLKGVDIDESTLDLAARAGAWELDGNSGTTATDFLGTTDSVPLNVRVNNARALRLEPASDGTNQSPNVVGGIADNAVTAGVHSATIGGGGRADREDPATANRVTDNFGTVGGGAGNQAGNANEFVNVEVFSTVGGGEENLASGHRSTVGGGARNSTTGSEAVVGGGFGNRAIGTDSAVGGGDQNLANGFRSTVGGGFVNAANGPSSTVGGGEENHANGSWSTVGGGFDNEANHLYSTVPGGFANVAASPYTLAAGRRAQALHDGAFVWADSNNLDFASTANNQFSARSTGGARFVSAIDGAGNPTAGVTLAPGGGSWAMLSDEASKQRIERVSGREVLATLASIPISEWSYRAQGPEVRHIGPMARDFHRAFGVGEDPRRITSIDSDGVALAAIKGLNEKLRRKLNRKQALIASHERRLDRLERLLGRRP